MTTIVFISRKREQYSNVPYTDSIYTLRVYKVTDDKRFELLVDTVSLKKLEEVAKEFKVIEETHEISYVSYVWGMPEG